MIEVNWIDAILLYSYLILPATVKGYRKKNQREKNLMKNDQFQELFTEKTLRDLFPAERANVFFEALYGDVEEGVYDISLAYEGFSTEKKNLQFLLNLSERPGKCLACHLTYGLPEVFSRHPIINIAGVVKEIDKLLGDQANCGNWRLEPTRTVSRNLYAVPLTIEVSE